MELMSRWECKDYKVNELLYAHNDTADSLYVILEGEI